MQEKLGTGLTSLSTFKGAVLEGVTYRHPLAHQVPPPPHTSALCTLISICSEEMWSVLSSVDEQTFYIRCSSLSQVRA